jgi:CBS domain-containing protein
MGDRSLPTVSDCMSAVRIRFGKDEDILAAMDRLIDHELAAAAVTDEEGTLLGVLTEKDCLRAVMSAAYDNVQSGGSVGEYMSPVASALTPDMDMLRAIEIFLSGNFPLLPVVEEGKLVGRVRRRDMLVHVRQLLDREGAVQRRQAQEADMADRPQGIEKMQQRAGSLGRRALAEIFSRYR